MKILGRHSVVNISECKFKLIDDVDEIRNLLMNSALEANLHVVDAKFHKFNPIGISGVLILAESHIAIHTWPEYNFVAIDAFTCGDNMNPENVCKIIARKLDGIILDSTNLNRGF